MNTTSNFWTGTAGSDVYTGDQQDEFIDGWTGNDILAGGLGDDFILGGDGIDAAKLSGLESEYTFSRTEDGEDLVVVGPDGRDTLSAVETIIFDDITYPVGQYSDIYEFSSVRGRLGNIIPLSDEAELSNGGTVTLTGTDSVSYPGYGTISYTARVFDSDEDLINDEISILSYSYSRSTVESGYAAILALPNGEWFAEWYLYSSGEYVREYYDSVGNLIGTGQGGKAIPIDYAVKVHGEALEGQILSVDTTILEETYTDENLAYQWRKDGVVIEGADEDAYLTSQDDVGSALSVTATYVDEDGVEQSFTSNFTSLIENSNDLPEGGVGLIGALEARSVLTVDASNLSDADALGPLSYQWLRDGADITDATQASYTLGIDDIGSEITIRVSYTDGFGTLETVTSTASGVVLPDPETRITGTEGADWLTGSDTGQLIEGLAGNDTILGGGGADLLQGGAGNDLLSGEGTLAVSFGLTIANQVYRFYQSALDRTPDAVGHAAWSERLADGESAIRVADSFVRSPEFTQTYANLSNTEFVELLYRNVLDRDPDAGGLARWTGDLAAGATRSDLLYGFSQSPEFINSTVVAASNFALDDTASDWADEVYRLYSATLNREPDVNGLQNWSARIGNGERTLLEVVDGFIRSPEFQNIYNDVTNAEFVTLLYQNVLNREPDAGGLARWTEQLDDGASRAQIVLGFSESPQFKANSAPLLEDWMRNKGADDIFDAGAGNNTLYGGILSDTFVFNVADGGSHTVMDLEIWDTLKFVGFGYASDDDIRQHMTQVDDDVVFADQDTFVSFVDVELASISDLMLL